MKFHAIWPAPDFESMELRGREVVLDSHWLSGLRT